MRAGRIALAAALAVLGVAGVSGDAAAAGPTTLVVCAPGYPGSTAEAQPAMDALAAAAARGANLKAGDLTAVYFETEKAGLDRLAAADAGLALVPLAFYLKHRAALTLEPVLQAVEEGGQAAESWTLVAPTGTVTSAASLAGFDLVGLVGYAPRFVRGPVLGAWGDVPRDVTIGTSASVLSGLRKASTGAKTAVLLDRAQAASLASLPFAAKLQVVTKSVPLPVSVLCTVGGRVPPASAKALAAGFLALGSTPAERAALSGVRLTTFVAVDQAAVAKARDAYERAKE